MKSIAKQLMAAGIAANLFFPACGNPEQEKQPAANEQVRSESDEMMQYTCEMHPEVISDKPGKCPKCGMALIKTENN